MTRAGIVTIAGKPNAGKSTLLNRLVGERLALTSPKAQSTRARVVGLRSDDTTQLVFFDTPGLLEPADALHVTMRGAAFRAIRDADVIVHLADARDGPPPLLWLEAGWEGEIPSTPVLVVLNKTDLLSSAALRALASDHPDPLRISAHTGDSVDALLTRLRSLVPEGPFLYPADDASTQNLRFFVAEMVRETALEELNDEIPHALAAVVEEFRESGTPVYIRVVMYVERDSQKRIVVGSGGERIRTIGQRSRAKIEPLVGGKVFLDLWVKVLPNWRRDAAALRRLGFSPTEDSVV
ncbi:MAG: GTPase Era [Gemmatimonadetes bacterium]|nr:GTPase Era [Gemmatimonadota bacterium]